MPGGLAQPGQCSRADDRTGRRETRLRRSHPRSAGGRLAGRLAEALAGRLAGGSRKRSGGFQAFDVAILEADRRETGRRLAGALKRLPGVRRSHPRSALTGRLAGGSRKRSSEFQAFDVAILEAPAGDTGRRLAGALKRLPGVRRSHPRSAGGRLAGDSRERSSGFQAFDVAILEAHWPGDWPEARGSAQAASRFRRMSQALKRLPGASSKRTGRETGRRLAEALAGRLAGGSRERSSGFQAFDVAILEAEMWRIRRRTWLHRFPPTPRRDAAPVPTAADRGGTSDVLALGGHCRHGCRSVANESAA